MTLTEEEAQIVRDFLDGLTRLLRGEHTNCLRCDQPIETLEQVGDCVYAQPCGHRQYQGTVPEAWKDYLNQQVAMLTTNWNNNHLPPDYCGNTNLIFDLLGDEVEVYYFKGRCRLENDGRILGIGDSDVLSRATVLAFLDWKRRAAE